MDMRRDRRPIQMTPMVATWSLVSHFSIVEEKRRWNVGRGNWVGGRRRA